MSAAPRTRPKYYDLNLAHLPPPGLVSIFHRISGALLFLLVPVALYALQCSLMDELRFNQVRDFMAQPVAKVLLLGVFWLYAHHFFAGIRYLLLDIHVGIDRQPARTTAYAVFVLGALATLLVGIGTW